jgi:hypothetical protein
MADSVKLPGRDVVVFNRVDTSLENITALLFEEIGSLELLTIARRDTIEGQNAYYSIISNLSAIKSRFNPTSIIKGQRPNQSLFDSFVIDINSRIPSDTYLDNNNLANFYYIDDNGNLVIELENMNADEIIEVEIATDGTIITGLNDNDY